VSKRQWCVARFWRQSLQTDDFEISPGLTFGTWMYDQVAQDCVIERTGWAPERVNRVAARLQMRIPEGERLEVVVPWTEIFTAFTAPDRFIYFSRRLLERCPDDESAAFVIAHEIAHHELGHLRIFPHWLAALAQVKGGWIAAAGVQAIERRLYGPEKECDADRRALDMCLAAGYDATRCMHLFAILEPHALDVGDTHIAFGLDPESDQELSDDASRTTKLRMWVWQRMRGYLPIQDRAGALREHLRMKAEDHAAES
jgi:hypothetical protein